MLQRPRPAWLRNLLEGLRPPKSSVSRLRNLFKQIEVDPQIKGVFLQLESLSSGWATRSALREQLLALRAKGKRVVVYLPEGGDQGTLFLASAADTVWIAPPATLTLLGPMASRTYIKPLLERVGVEIDVLAQGAYKTAAEPLARASMSDREREQLSAIVGTLNQTLRAAVAERPGIDPAQVDGLFAQAMFNAEQAIAAGLVDAALYEDEVHAELGFTDKKKRPITAARYMSMVRKPVWRPLHPAPKVVVLRLEGAIGAMAAARGIELRPTTAALRSLADDSQVAGVVLYIDSPGGSAVVSDLLHREVARLASKKPVVAWLGNVAASGGYYLAVAAQTIIAEPTTITGSIGVISVRPVISALLSEIGVRREVVKQTDHADIYDLSRPLTEGERSAIIAETEHFYARFLDVVAAGRSQPVETIRALAGGRVWSGRDAKAHGLVDELGGYEQARAAIDALLEARGIQADSQASIVSPARRDVTPPPPIQVVLDALCVALPQLAPMHDLLALATAKPQAAYYAFDLPLS